LNELNILFRSVSNSSVKQLRAQFRYSFILPVTHTNKWQLQRNTVSIWQLQTLCGWNGDYVTADEKTTVKYCTLVCFCSRSACKKNRTYAES